MAPRVITSDNKNRDDDDCNDNYRSESAKTNTMTLKEMAKLAPVLVPGKVTFIEGCSKVTPEHPHYAALMKSAAKLDAKLAARRAARRAAKQQRNGGIRKKECPVSIGKQKKNKVSTSTNARKD